MGAMRPGGRWSQLQVRRPAASPGHEHSHRPVPALKVPARTTRRSAWLSAAGSLLMHALLVILILTQLRREEPAQEARAEAEKGERQV